MYGFAERMQDSNGVAEMLDRVMEKVLLHLPIRSAGHGCTVGILGMFINVLPTSTQRCKDNSSRPKGTRSV